MECLELFRRQYLQLLPSEQLSFPPGHILKLASVQAWLFEELFKEEAGACAGAGTSNERHHCSMPIRYKARVLKALVSRLEASIRESDQNDDEVGDDYDEISDDLMSCLAGLMASNMPPEAVSVQWKYLVRYTLPAPLTAPSFSSAVSSSLPREPGAVAIRESRGLIAAAGTTGLRTWDAALRLGSYLYLLEARRAAAATATNATTAAAAATAPASIPTPASVPAPVLVRGMNVLELGAGTGFLSVLCAKYLGARRVLATDGDARVVEDMRANFALNGLHCSRRRRHRRVDAPDAEDASCDDDDDDGDSGANKDHSRGTVSLIQAKTFRWGDPLSRSGIFPHALEAEAGGEEDDDDDEGDDDGDEENEEAETHEDGYGCSGGIEGASGFSSSGGGLLWDIVLAADVIYDTASIPALVQTFGQLFTHNPAVRIVVASTVRNEHTFNEFLSACQSIQGLLIHNIPFHDDDVDVDDDEGDEEEEGNDDASPALASVGVGAARQQTGFFHERSAAAPIRLLLLTLALSPPPSSSL